MRFLFPVLLTLMAMSFLAAACGSGGAPERRLAPVEDFNAFIQPYLEQAPEAFDCHYEDGNTLIDCRDAGFGTFHLDQPVPGSEVTCGVRVLNDEPVFMSCLSQDPIFPVFYQLVDQD